MYCALTVHCTLSVRAVKVRNITDVPSWYGIHHHLQYCTVVMYTVQYYTVLTRSRSSNYSTMYCEVLYIVLYSIYCITYYTVHCSVYSTVLYTIKLAECTYSTNFKRTVKYVLQNGFRQIRRRTVNL